MYPCVLLCTLVYPSVPLCTHETNGVPLCPIKQWGRSFADFDRSAVDQACHSNWFQSPVISEYLSKVACKVLLTFWIHYTMAILCSRPSAWNNLVYPWNNWCTLVCPWNNWVPLCTNETIGVPLWTNETIGVPLCTHETIGVPLCTLVYSCVSLA